MLTALRVRALIALLDFIGASPHVLFPSTNVPFPFLTTNTPNHLRRCYGCSRCMQLLIGPTIMIIRLFFLWRHRRLVPFTLLLILCLLLFLVIESPFKHEIFEEDLMFGKSLLVKVTEEIFVSLIHADKELSVVLSRVEARLKAVQRRRYNNPGRNDIV